MTSIIARATLAVALLGSLAGCFAYSEAPPRPVVENPPPVVVERPVVVRPAY